MDLTQLFGVGSYSDFKLKNGLRVVAVCDNDTPIISGSIIVHAGSKESPDTGIAHYFEHMMFKGTESIGTVDYEKEKPYLDEIERLYDQLGRTNNTESRTEIQMRINDLSIQAAQYAIPNDLDSLVGQYGGTNLNAATSFDYTRYDHDITPEYLEHWCAINSERFLHPIFRLFQSELETIYEEKNMYANRLGNEAYNRLNYKKYYPHPYAYPIIGASEAILNPSIQEMRAFFDKYYVPGNMGIVLTGPLPEKTALQDLLERTFGRMVPKEVTFPKNTQPEPYGLAEKLYLLTPTIHARSCQMIWQTVPLGHPDLLILQLLQEMCNNESKTGILDQLVLSNKLPSVAAWQSSRKEAGDFTIYIMPHPGKQSYRQAEDIVWQSLHNLKEDKPEYHKLFDNVRQGLLKTQLLLLEGAKTRHSMLVNLMKDGSDLKELGEELDRMKSLQYSEVVRIVETYISPHFLDVRDRKGNYKVERIPKSGYKPIPTNDPGLVSPFAKNLETLKVPQWKLTLKPLEDESPRHPLPEQPLLGLYHTHNSYNDIFTLDFIHFRKKRGNPAMHILPDYLEMVGAEALPATNFFAKMEELGATLSFSAREDSFIISLCGFDDKLKETLSLVRLFFDAPERDKVALQQEQTNYRQIYRTRLQTETSLFSLAFNAVLKGSEKAVGLTVSPNEVCGVTLDSLLDEFQKVRTTEGDIHYCGTHTVEEVQGLISEYLSPVPLVSVPAEPYSYDPPVLSDESKVFTFLDPNNGSQAMIGSIWTLGKLSEEERELLSFYAYYLGGSMSSLLFREIRESRSIAYSVHATDFTPQPLLSSEEERISAFAVRMNTREDKVKEAMESVCSLIQETPMTLERIRSTQERYRSFVYNDLPATFRQKSRRVAMLTRSGYKEDPIVSKNRISELPVEELVGKLEVLHEKYIQKAKPLHLVFGGQKALDHTLFEGKVIPLSIQDITKPLTI